MKLINTKIIAVILVMVSSSLCYAEETSAPLTPSLTGSFRADLMTGAAVMNVPISVAPGRGGIQPNISLAYASGNPNGLCGLGWQLEFGAIKRNAKFGVPSYDATDSFVANMSGANTELIDIGGGEYRAKQEGAFLKFSFDGTSWTVKDKGGTTYFFGSSRNERQQDGQNGGRVFGWYLEKTLDVHGNYMLITYFQDQNQIYPLQIQYTGKEGAGALLPTHTVDFIYEPRNDLYSNYRPNFEVTTNKRLWKIDVKASGQDVRQYELNYTYSTDTSRSLLTSVVQYGNDRISKLPPVTFEYQSGGGI